MLKLLLKYENMWFDDMEIVYCSLFYLRDLACSKYSTNLKPGKHLPNYVVTMALSVTLTRYPKEFRLHIQQSISPTMKQEFRNYFEPYKSLLGLREDECQSLPGNKYLLDLCVRVVKILLE
jgi:hypothetical protein